MAINWNRCVSNWSVDHGNGRTLSVKEWAGKLVLNIYEGWSLELPCEKARYPHCLCMLPAHTSATPQPFHRCECSQGDAGGNLPHTRRSHSAGTCSSLQYRHTPHTVKWNHWENTSLWRSTVPCCADHPTWDSVLMGEAGAVEDAGLWLDQIRTGWVLCWRWESEDLSGPVSGCFVVARLHKKPTKEINFIIDFGWKRL